MRIRLLGGVGAVDRHGEPVDIGPAKCRAVLAALALSAGSAVPVWRLVELVWDEDPPRTAARTLQAYVTRLRKSLGQGSIVRVGEAYRLEVPPDSVDVLRFQQAAGAGDVESALAEWTGFPLAGLAAPGLAPAVDGLVERWLSVVEADLEARVEKSPAAATAQLTELTAAHPYRERLWALLMTALYRTGRQGDALAAYRTARRHLVEQLGVEPGPHLRELESLVLDHDDRLAPVRRNAGTAPPGNLPQRLGRLFGRDTDLAAIASALGAYPVVTLVGPGGIGKTRLALAAARRAVPRGGADDGAWLVDLTEIASPGDVPRAVAGPLGIQEGPGRALGECIVTALRSRHALLVLDNCEHVIEGAARLAQAIADGCPDVRILATSREGLGLAHGHERLIAVPPLEPDGAGAELFNERASAACRTFDPRAARHEVERICRRLDGIPLAIELAATRVASLAPADLLVRLDDQLGLLAGGPRAGAVRHRTLRATVQWSYDLLGPAEQRLFQRLSIFAGPFDLAAAETVGAEEGTTDLAGVLAGLVDRSMLVAEPGPAGRWYRFLEPMRRFAAERLAEAGRDGPIADRHARWCLDRAGTIHRLLTGPDEVEGVARLDELWPNLRAAFSRACGTGDRRLAHALVRPVVAEVPFRSRTEIGEWAERLLAITPPDDEELVVFGLTWAAQRAKWTHDPGSYERLVDRYGEPDHPLIRHARASVHEDDEALAKWAPPALAELRRRGDHDLAEQLELDVGAALLFRGYFDEGEAHVAALADRYRAQGPPTMLNWALMLLGYSAAFQGEHDRAEDLFEEAVDVRVPARTYAPNRPVQARVLFRRGDRPRAFAILRSHIDELLGTGNMYAACVVSVEFIVMTAAMGRLEDAARILSYLDTTGLLAGPAWETQVAGVRERLAAAAVPYPARGLDDQQALLYMRGVLHGLAEAAGPGTAGAATTGV